MTRQATAELANATAEENARAHVSIDSQHLAL